jgi:thymidylate kinase
MSHFTVLTGLDGSGTSTVAVELSKMDNKAKVYNSIIPPFRDLRKSVDSIVLNENIISHYFFYLSALAYTTEIIRKDLKDGYNVYCERYLIDTVISHRVHGMNIELTYEIDGYNFLKPDFTFFLELDEVVRQDRIAKREKGKNMLDKTLDDDDFRKRFLNEFCHFENDFIRINNNNSLDSTLSIICSIIKEKT